MWSGSRHRSYECYAHDSRCAGTWRVIHSFESYAGGLIAPESDNNPWKYKFTWNPRNIVLSGQGVARFYWKDQLKLIPYNKLFQRYDLLEVPGYGTFEGYPNRDSTKYKSLYGLDGTHTLVRGILLRRRVIVMPGTHWWHWVSPMKATKWIFLKEPPGRSSLTTICLF